MTAQPMTTPPAPPVRPASPRGAVGVDTPPDQTTAEMHAALVAALRAQGYTVVGYRQGRRYWGKAPRPVQLRFGAGRPAGEDAA